VLIQTAERKHAREVHEQDPTAWWPRDAVDRWWRACKRSDERPEMVALRQLDAWKYRLNYGHHLLIPAFQHHLQETGGATVALPLDSISVAALCAYSSTHKLRAAATSPMQIRRAGDNTTAELSFTAANLTDTTGISSHCTTNNGFCSIWRDQGASGHNVDNAAGVEPQVYTGGSPGTLKTLSNGKFALALNGSNQRLGKTTLFGLTGSPALTVAWTMQQTDPDSFCWWLGASSGTGANFFVDFYTVARVATTGGYREFTYASPIVNPARWVVTKAASGTPSGFTCEQNGTALTQSAVLNGSTAMNLSGTNGFRIGSNISDTECCAMVAGMFGMFNSVLTGSDKTALDAMLSLSVP